MKNFIITLCALFICSVSNAQTETMNWYVDGTVYDTTTCESGADVILPTPPTKRGYTFEGWGAKYRRVNYIESTGTQWIDTGIHPNGLIRMKAKIETLRDGGASSAFSGVIYPDRISRELWQVVYPYQQGVDFNVSQEEIIFSKSYIGLQEFDVDQVSRKIELNNDIKYMSNIPVALETGHSNIPLCKYQNELIPHDNYWYGKVYFVKIWDNNTLVRDFIPVLDPYDVPCLYDKVSGMFFYNSGTGDFIAGPTIELED